MLNHIFSSALLAMALSLDGFGAGVTYGLRKTRIPLLSVLIISLCSGLVLGVSMQAGALLQRFLSPSVASVIGAAILILLGLWSLYQQVRRRSESEAQPVSASGISESLTEAQAALNQRKSIDGGAGTAEPEELQKAVFSLEIPKIGVVIQILRSPTKADLDDSGSISPWEAMWLGIALSLDAFGAGLGAAMLGFSPLGTAAVVALFSGIFLVMGMRIGLRFASKGGMRFISYLPAFLLIVMGIMKLL
ncbi:sporulation protein YtaF [Paenibacillus vortex V453]|uniref:Sporulation protein YtaF n=1 Tax=Paenibacillus vortex V453 TaxID=715225 RepID=A0A2R9SP39_9BACL|nr:MULTISPECIES: MntP/YtaF family protein [Paenibacillus]EFU39129.1 sporulation protein YtaF [Paenibacillus vortex V453]MDH6670137.1 putative Mn2+ efflux pump MntP [Paenibacillus sp. LBL]